MSRRRYFIGSTGPFFYETDRQLPIPEDEKEAAIVVELEDGTFVRIGGTDTVGGGGESIAGVFVPRLPETGTVVQAIPITKNLTLEYDPAEDATGVAGIAPGLGESASFEVEYEAPDGTVTTLGKMDFQSGATKGTWTPSVSSPITMQSGSVSIPSDPVFYNPLDGDADSLVGPDGTINGNPQATTGVNGGSGEALKFRGIGSGDWIDLSGVTVNGLHTLSLWVYPTALNDFGRLLSVSQDQNHLILASPSGGISYRPNPNNSNFVAGNVPLNEWTHIACVWNGSERIIYQDGSEVGRNTLSTSVMNSGYAISESSGTHEPAARLDEPRIYDRALSASEVQQLFNNPTATGQGTGAELRIVFTGEVT